MDKHQKMKAISKTLLGLQLHNARHNGNNRQVNDDLRFITQCYTMPGFTADVMAVKTSELLNNNANLELVEQLSDLLFELYTTL